MIIYLWLYLSLFLTGPMLRETCMDQRTVLNWSGSVLAKVAKERYLGTPSIVQTTHNRVSAYFIGEYLEGNCFPLRSDQRSFEVNWGQNLYSDDLVPWSQSLIQNPMQNTVLKRTIFFSPWDCLFIYKVTHTLNLSHGLLKQKSYSSTNLAWREEEVSIS